MIVLPVFLVFLNNKNKQSLGFAETIHLMFSAASARCWNIYKLIQIVQLNFSDLKCVFLQSPSKSR